MSINREVISVSLLSLIDGKLSISAIVATAAETPMVVDG